MSEKIKQNKDEREYQSLSELPTEKLEIMLKNSRKEKGKYDKVIELNSEATPEKSSTSEDEDIVAVIRAKINQSADAASKNLDDKIEGVRSKTDEDFDRIAGKPAAVVPPSVSGTLNTYDKTGEATQGLSESPDDTSKKTSDQEIHFDEELGKDAEKFIKARDEEEKKKKLRSELDKDTDPNLAEPIAENTAKNEAPKASAIENTDTATEMDLATARQKYAQAYKEFHDKKSTLSKKIDDIRNFFGLKKDKYAEKKESAELKEAREIYQEAKNQYGKKLLEKKNEELLAQNLIDQERIAALDMFKSEMVINKIIDERKNLDTAIKGSLGSPEQSKISKIVQSSAEWMKRNKKKTKYISNGLLVAGTLSSLGMNLPMRALKILGYRTLFKGFTIRGKEYLKGGIIEKAWSEKSIEERRREKIKKLGNAFVEGRVGNWDEIEKEYLKIAGSERKEKILKAGVTNAAKIAFICEALDATRDFAQMDKSGMTNAAMEKIDNLRERFGIGSGSTATDEIAEPRYSDNSPVSMKDGELEFDNGRPDVRPPLRADEISADDISNKGDISPAIAEAYSQPISIQAGSGDGGIKMFQNLQETLESRYPDPTKAPADIQEIMKSTPEKLAMKYGLYDPNSANESLMVHKGDSLIVSKDGTVSFERAGQLHDPNSMKARGMMFDSDNSGQVPKPADTQGWPAATDEKITTGTEFKGTNLTTDWPAATDSIDTAEPSGWPTATDVEASDKIPVPQDWPAATDERMPNTPDGQGLDTAPEPSTLPENEEYDELPLRQEIDDAGEPGTTGGDNEVESRMEPEPIELRTQKQVISDINKYFDEYGPTGRKTINGIESDTWEKVGGQDAAKTLDQMHKGRFDEGNTVNTRGARTFKDYVLNLERTTGMRPLQNQNLEDYILRATRYQIEHQEVVENAQAPRGSIDKVAEEVETDDVYYKPKRK